MRRAVPYNARPLSRRARVHRFKKILFLFHVLKPTNPDNFQNLNFLQKYKTYEMCQKFKDHDPKLFKKLNLAKGNG